ncbi:MAG: hypothetical protein R6W70_03145, partial [bacterium]
MKNTIFMIFFISMVFMSLRADELDDYKTWLRSQGEVSESEKDVDRDSYDRDMDANDSESYDEEMPDRDSFEEDSPVKNDSGKKTAEKEQESEKEVYYVIKRDLTPVPCTPRADME